MDVVGHSGVIHYILDKVEFCWKVRRANLKVSIMENVRQANSVSFILTS